MAKSTSKKTTTATRKTAGKTTTANTNLNGLQLVSQLAIAPFHPPVSQPVALQNIGNWRNIMRPLMGSNFLRGFYIPHGDYINLAAKYPDSRGIRAYFAILDPNTVGSVHLYIVPVDEFGNDMIVPTPEDLVVDGQASTVYDFTQPCPNQCDYNSPYYDGK